MLCVVQVPISLVYRKELAKKDGSTHMLLHGYGSYEYAYDPRFVQSPALFLLLLFYPHGVRAARTYPRMLLLGSIWQHRHASEAT